MTTPSSTTPAVDAALREAGLARMKTIPLLLLGLMVLLVIAAQWLPDAALRGYVVAFAEAAIVGGLADWFAVTALFRHPLGIPVPHTAIIPRRKDQLAESLAEFVDSHFLTAATLGAHLEDTDVAGALARWSLRHRDDLADAGVRLARWAVDSLRDSDYRRYLHEKLLGKFDGGDLAPVTGRLLELMIANRQHQALLTELLRTTSASLDANRDQIRDQIQSDSPWWLPGFIDDKIYDQMVERIQTQLLAMVLDPRHDLRQRLDASLGELAQRLQHDPTLRQRFAEAGAKLRDDATVQAYLAELLESIGEIFRRELDVPRGTVHRAIRAAVGRMAIGALRDDALRERFDQSFKRGILYAITTQGAPLTGVITRTVQQWDGVETAHRIELQVGKDLQYIRINGTLVGGFIGLILHAATSVLG
ncbi:MAG: DUF445 domain-containing protein [Pseudomonadota bacterium]